MFNANYEVMGDLKARDWIAVLALQGMLANSSTTSQAISNKAWQEELAQAAYECADAVLKRSQQTA